MGRRTSSARYCLHAALLASASIGAYAEAAAKPMPRSSTASAPADEDASSELELWGFDLQLDQVVVSSTKQEQRAVQTPAVIAVVHADEIQRRGYRSLAEVLRTIPGMYDAYDLVTHNVGVRGINGGARASGRIIKLMIDGLAVDFRPTTGNFFGEELIPIQLIERVEIIRGPASAIYGANAYLGAINVITKSGEALNGFHLAAQGNLTRQNPGGGGALLAGAKAGVIDLLAGVSLSWSNRSGLSLPATSPLLSRAGSALDASRRTSGDDARPASGFAKLTIDNVLAKNGKLTLRASLQNLDASAEFADTGPMTDRTRTSILNQNYQMEYELKAIEALTLRLSGNYFHAAPTARDLIDVGQPAFVALRRVATEGFNIATDVRWRIVAPLTLTLGADFTQEHHRTQTFDQLLVQDVTDTNGAVTAERGTVRPATPDDPLKLFRNVGVYLQALFSRGDWTAVLGGRVDVHNIYKVNVSPRAGVVYAPESFPISVKLLYGSSFKPPTAEELYTTPLKVDAVIGNESLLAQRAHTGELALALKLPNGLGEITLNGSASLIMGRVEYLRAGLYSRAQNLNDAWVIAAELDARLVLHRSLFLRVAGEVARTVAQQADQVTALLPKVTNPLYPLFQAHLIGDYALPFWSLRVAAEVSLVGPRNASQANAALAGRNYELPPYVFGALSLSTSQRLWAERQTNIALRVSSPLQAQASNPGFGGVDFPLVGVEATLSVVQQF